MKNLIKVGDAVVVNSNINNYKYKTLCDMKEGQILLVKSFSESEKLLMNDGSMYYGGAFLLSDELWYHPSWIDLLIL